MIWNLLGKKKKKTDNDTNENDFIFLRRSIHISWWLSNFLFDCAKSDNLSRTVVLENKITNNRFKHVFLNSSQGFTLVLL